MEKLCDICGKGSQQYTCCSCGRNICSVCTYRHFPAGDIIERYCSVCYSLKFDKYSEEYLHIKNEYNDEVKKLDAKVRKVSRRWKHV